MAGARLLALGWLVALVVALTADEAAAAPECVDGDFCAVEPADHPLPNGPPLDPTALCVDPETCRAPLAPATGDAPSRSAPVALPAVGLPEPEPEVRDAPRARSRRLGRGHRARLERPPRAA